MRLKLWHKLILTIVSITAIVLTIALLLSNQSVKTGFLAYLNSVEERRIEDFSEILLTAYEEENSWDFIRENRRLWGRYYNESRRLGNQNSRGKRPPRLAGLGERSGTGSQVNPNNQNENERRRRSMLRIPVPKTMALLDSNKALIVGGVEPSAEAKFIPLTSGDKLVAYIRIEPYTKITEDLDQQFIEHENKAFIRVALLSLGIILIGTWILANYLRKRINVIGDHATRLTSGKFDSFESDRSTDELGELSRRLSILGETLEHNRLSRQRWMSDISHELRTPVAVIQGELEAMQDGVRPLNETSVNSLHQEILRLSRLVGDLHELSMSDIGALSYHKEPVDLVDLIDGVIASKQNFFDQKQISVEMKASKESASVMGDFQRLEQLFSNLAENSHHYTSKKGSLSVEVEKRKSEVVIKWSDSTPGVDGQELPQNF